MKKAKIILLIALCAIFAVNIKKTYDNYDRFSLKSQLCLKVPNGLDPDVIFYSSDINRLLLCMGKSKFFAKYDQSPLLKFSRSIGNLINGVCAGSLKLNSVKHKNVFMIFFDEETCDSEILFVIPEFYMQGVSLKNVSVSDEKIFEYYDETSESIIFYTRVNDSLVCSRRKDYIKKLQRIKHSKSIKKIYINFDEIPHFSLIFNCESLRKKILKSDDLTFLGCHVSQLVNCSKNSRFSGMILNDAVVLKQRHFKEETFQKFNAVEGPFFQSFFDCYTIVCKDYLKNWLGDLYTSRISIDKNSKNVFNFIFNKVKYPVGIVGSTNSKHNEDFNNIFLLTYDRSDKDIIINELTNLRILHKDLDRYGLYVFDENFLKRVFRDESCAVFPKNILFYDTYAMMSVNESELLEFANHSCFETRLSAADIATYSRYLSYLVYIKMLNNLPVIVSNISDNWQSSVQDFLIELDYILLEEAYLPKFKQNEFQILLKSKN